MIRVIGFAGKPVGGQIGKSVCRILREVMPIRHNGGEVTDAMLPGKASRELSGDRTANRHRWARRES